jgi:hypothetical protein
MHSALDTLRRITPPLPPEELRDLVPPSSREASDDLARMRSAILEYDLRRYGMPLQDLQRFVHEEERQRTFQAAYGIPFEEYAQRFIGGEPMGVALRDGKFQAPPQASLAAAKEPANQTFLEGVIAHLAKYLVRPVPKR